MSKKRRAMDAEPVAAGRVDDGNRDTRNVEKQKKRDDPEFQTKKIRTKKNLTPSDFQPLEEPPAGGPSTWTWIAKQSSDVSNGTIFPATNQLPQNEATADAGIQKMSVNVGIQTTAYVADAEVQATVNMVDAEVQTTGVMTDDGGDEDFPNMMPTFEAVQEGSNPTYSAQVEGILHGNPLILNGSSKYHDEKTNLPSPDVSAIVRYEYDIQIEIPTINLILGTNPKKIPCLGTDLIRKQERTMLSGLRMNVEHFYINDKPKHISDPDRSMFRIISSEDEVYLSPKKVQKILRERHIVVTNVKSHTTTFDHRGLETLSPLNAIVTIDGNSIRRTSRSFRDSDARIDQGYRGVHHPATLKQFIDRCADRTTKNILHVSHMKSELHSRQAPYSTNFVVCRETAQEPHCEEEKNRDMTIIKWYDLATENAVQGWRLVPHGFGAALEVSTGKMWVVVVDAGTDASNFLPYFDPMSATNRSGIPMEAIVLHEGAKLILRPNTLYTTVALENSALQGEYYLASHTLMSSLHGLIHSFIMGSSVTFDDDIAPMLFIRRMVHYFHNSLVSNSDLDPTETPIQLHGRSDDYMVKGTNEADRFFSQGFECGFQISDGASGQTA
ncbi:hypothetical protein M413DRAFT_419911 [Hebeloma cylindrosporum]|uniref:Uncharacterized protein n=1 Tax=Hebeloma cylindrosporum TaxID=76867 RepID=A0A0C3C5P4_HEBCY|nr:hypothetical protein M413DRAFT_419911 [Hebeloma cylindrosporum h7]